MDNKEEELVDRRKLREEVKNRLEELSVKDLVSIMATNLASVGFSKLGLGEGDKKDLNQAKLAIDALDALYKVVSNYLSSEENKILEVALSNLKINYAKEVQ